MRIITFACLAAVGMTAPAFAAQDQSAAVATAAKADDGKKICRKVKTTGSRLGGTTECRTKREWEALQRATQDEMRNRPENTGY